MSEPEIPRSPLTPKESLGLMVATGIWFGAMVGLAALLQWREKIELERNQKATPGRTVPGA